MIVITDEHKPIKMWATDIEDGAMRQARNLANLPFTFKHVAIMPDAHQGYGMPIGGVLAAKDVVIPNAVGVDIGCGMCAMRTSLTDISTTQIKKILGGSKGFVGGIRGLIPVGFNHHKKNQEWIGFDDPPEAKHNGSQIVIPIIAREMGSARKQLGTLGGGNHFIEIQKGDDGHIWIMVHSGSRNFGYKIAKFYNQLAQKLNTKWFPDIPPFKGEDGLAFLPMETDEAHEYLAAMNYALDFAYANRIRMLEAVRVAFLDVVSCSFESEINIHHNYAALENHFEENVIVHRKGATSARSGEIGIIPGSQGTASYIVEGLGNPESFYSCSHGAGRKMSRNQAKRGLNLQKEIEKMNKLGVIHGIRNENDLDEAPGAYKDIDTVMENQSDLVKIKVRLTPLAVVKG
ncbi:RtcB family protein [bacterium]|nr:RtcB family protein [bacterium]